jgi:thiamine biosynthesis lipoprotein
MNAPIKSRRSFLHHLALPMAAPLLIGCGKKPKVPSVFRWSGIGFGIGMSMEIHGVQHEQGVRLGEFCESRIRAMEDAFSLYQENSELQHLNRERSLTQPSPLFRQLLRLSMELSRRTMGYFQPAIHGAWQWLQAADTKTDLTAAPEWQRLCEASDLRFIECGEDGPIRLLHPLTQISMNAIGQGFLADLVAARLREAGIASAMLHLGESYAIGSHPEGRPWSLAVRGNDESLIDTMDLTNCALAVSANSPERMLIDPVSREIRRNDRVAAVASTEGAAAADAFATAFAACPSDAWQKLTPNLQPDTNSQVRLWEGSQLVYLHG